MALNLNIQREYHQFVITTPLRANVLKIDLKDLIMGVQSYQN